jgi:selenide,water dikinase
VKAGARIPVVKDLVLIGGGHSHVAVLKRFGMRPLDGVRLTLVTRDVHTPYSGMLPGYIAGHYALDEFHIDLWRLAQFAGARLYHHAAVGLDLVARKVICEGRPAVPYDVVSIDVGSTPATDEVPGAAQHTVPVKPIGRFVEQWERLAERLTSSGARHRVAVVGAGAGGTELSLAIQYRLRKTLAERGETGDRLEFHLISGAAEVMPEHDATTRAKFARILTEHGITTHLDRTVVEVRQGALVFADGESLEADEILWATHAAAQRWLKRSGLAVDENGFVAVADTLRSVSHPEVFAAGDIAAVQGHPRPKAGVFAVRQGPPLADNLRRALVGLQPQSFHPQHDYLSLVSTGEKYCVASRNGLALEGRWVWRVKDWIDRTWMRKYVDLPEMATAGKFDVPAGLADGDTLAEISAAAMRCGGCGAKVGATILARVINELTPVERDDVLIGLKAPDDAAVVEMPPGKVMVHSVDYFRALVDDPYLFGRITANHSLGDLYAMGAEPQSALVIATVPYGIEAKVEADLRDIMAGALATLRENGVALVGGHTSEGAELALGFSVNGIAERDALLRKGGMRPADALILTKPIGTGVLFAADMCGKAMGRWIDAAIAAMLQSSREAARCLMRHGATACTDVTGFGLLGHLMEMVKSSDVDVDLLIDAVPVLDGTRECVAAGIFSSLQPANVRLKRAVRGQAEAARHPLFPLLFDPQTAGGLLAALPRERAEACVAELRASGCGHAAIVGRVLARSAELEPVRIVPGPPVALTVDPLKPMVHLP